LSEAIRSDDEGQTKQPAAGRTPSSANLSASRDRSPRYPTLSFPQALNSVRKVYEVFKHRTMPEESVVSSLGYTSLNGASRRRLSTLRKYGLLVANGPGLRISDDAVTVLELGDDDPAAAEALRRLALKPAAFKMLFDRYGQTLPAEKMLRVTLLHNGYQSDAADQLIKVYRETADYLEHRAAPSPATPNLDDDTALGSIELGERNSQSITSRGREPGSAAIGMRARIEPPRRELTPGILTKREQDQGEVSQDQNKHAPSNQKHLRFQISRDCEAEVVFRGKITQEGIDKLCKLLDLSKDVFPMSSDTGAEARTLPSSTAIRSDAGLNLNSGFVVKAAEPDLDEEDDALFGDLFADDEEEE